MDVFKFIENFLLIAILEKSSYLQHGRAKSKKVDELKVLLYLPDLQFSLIIETKIQIFKKFQEKMVKLAQLITFERLMLFT